MTQLIIFTDLDSVWLAPETDDLAALKLSLAQLKALSIPVILTTNRARAEVEPLRAELALGDPFITEGGSGVFIPTDLALPLPDWAEPEGDYAVLELGCPYVQARAGLRVVANELQHSLLGFGDLTIERLQKRTGLSASAAQQAKAREFSEPFLTPKAVESEALTAAAEAIGFRVVTGERFSWLMGPEASLRAAVQQVAHLYQSAETAVETVGLSATLTELLAAVDTPIALPTGSAAAANAQGAPDLAEWIAAAQALCRVR
ncbi:MAG: haloacid dehalogenase [Leptolyngbya sp. SIO4C1]|nr:haloacid dehalogenase [Leptolyngbya sp. SIO4C1]